MFRNYLIILFSLLSGIGLQAQQLEPRLQKAGFEQIKPFDIESNRYSEAFQMLINQAVDHKNEDGQHFGQRVFIRHRGFDRPTILVTEGYAAGYALIPQYDEELAMYLDANLVVVEHRYFGESLPEPKDWKYLNLSNATADLHHVNQILREVYKGPWISTGISKGGQTTIYYRYFYPDDVEASVPYVAPLNFSVADKRVYHFQDTVANLECRTRLKEIQRDLLSRREIYEKMFADSATARGLTFAKVGGVHKAFEYNVLELGFAYWQWYPVPCDALPATGADPHEIFTVFVNAAGYDFFADQSISDFEPFFYQALTEMGFYSYNITDFKDLLLYVKNPGFTHTLPDGIHVKYSNRLIRKVNRWIQKDGNNMLYVYGAYDAWASTAVQIGSKTNARKFLLPGGSHASRLRNFNEKKREEAISLLQQWIAD